MFAKILSMSFIYKMLEIFCFPDKNVKAILKKCGVERVNTYHVLTDTDSTSLKFLFVRDPNSDVLDSKYRDIIFKVITAWEVYETFDSSREYWDGFGARNEDLRKNLGYFEIEHNHDPCIVTIACNPKNISKCLRTEILT